ncbi:MAG: hypothetical protein ACJATI_001664 [Halioglobus sp.]|jgi:hypothetical protein
MKFLPFTLCILLSSISYAQDVAWTFDNLGKHANIIQTDDGMILLSDETSLISLQPRTGELNWTVKDIKDLDELSLMSDFPYLKNTGKYYSIIDSRDGKLLSYHPEKTYIVRIDELLGAGKLIFNLKSDNKDVVEVLDLKTNKLWSTKIADKIKGNGILGTYDTPKPVVTDSGKLLIFRKEAFHILNINDGSIQAQIELEDSYDLLSVTEDKSAFIIHWDNKMLKAYSAETGDLLWETKNKSKNLEVLSAGADNNDWLLLDKKKYTIYDTKSNSPKIEGKWKSEPTFFYNFENRLFAGIKKDLVELDKTTLEIIKNKTFEHNVKSLSMVNGTILIQTKYMNEINLNDFNLVYPYKNKIPFLISDIIDTDNYVLYVNRSYQNMETAAINKNGKELWSYSSTSISPPSIDILQGDRILIITDTKMAMLNAVDGEKIWKKNLTLKPGFAYALNENTNNLSIYNDNKTGYINLDTGELFMFNEKVKFKDFDHNLLSPSIAMLDNGIYLKGSNSIAYYKLDGTQVYNNHYKKSDNSSAFMKLAGAAVTVGALASGNAGKVMTVTNASTGEVLHKGSMVDDINNNYAYSEQMAAKRQRNANRGSFAIPYVFTKLESGDRGLIFFDMLTGEEKYNITMTEKEPKYIFDEYEKMIYYKDTKEKKIKAFSLK